MDGKRRTADAKHRLPAYGVFASMPVGLKILLFTIWLVGICALPFFVHSAALAFTFAGH